MPYKNKEDKREWEKRTKAKTKFLNKYPWQRLLRNIRSRCSGKSHHYFRKGIKNFLNTESIKFLWLRDKAYEFIKPSVDRINPDGNYSLDNCRIVELEDNLKRRAQCRTI